MVTLKHSHDISVAEKLDLPLEETRLQEALTKFLQAIDLSDRFISLYLTDDEEIRRFNHEHRQKDSATDVLSWSYYEDDPESPCMGEVAISLERVNAQAKANNWTAEVELLRLLAHAIAHLAGWDHERSDEEEKAMLAIEIDMLERVGLTGLYPQTQQ